MSCEKCKAELKAIPANVTMINTTTLVDLINLAIANLREPNEETEHAIDELERWVETLTKYPIVDTMH